LTSEVANSQLQNDHIFPWFTQTVLDVDWWWIKDILWQFLPSFDYSLWEKWLPSSASCRSASWLKKLLWMSSNTNVCL